MKAILLLIGVGTIFLLGAVFGYCLGTNQWSLPGLLQIAKNKWTEVRLAEQDEYGRLVAYKGKQSASCPKQDERLGVLLFLGQSNVANHSEYRYTSDELGSVYNYFDGQCYPAASPLLGSTGLDGEWASRTAALLIAQGTYDEVVVLSSAVAGSAVTRWAEGNDLNHMLAGVIESVVKDYKVTDVIWHQGEGDKGETFPATYRNMFLSMRNTLLGGGVTAPIFVSVATVCGDDFVYPNRIASVQMQLPDLNGIEAGVNTDELVTPEMRYDRCHFAKSAQEAVSQSLSALISDFHRRP